MKKLFLVILSVMLLASCGGNTDVVTPSPSPETSPEAESKMITATKENPIGDDWTILGEVGLVIEDEFADIYLATEARRGDDGYMLWDDSQDWALVVVGEENNYVLFDSNIYGKAYIDVETIDNLPRITLVTTSSFGPSVTRYTYSEGAFYQEELIIPDANGNNIYSSFPDYIG